MLDRSSSIVCRSWPRLVAHSEAEWTSEPDRDAPPMPFLPQPVWDLIEDRDARR
jgi:hypothetical protein